MEELEKDRVHRFVLAMIKDAKNGSMVSLFNIMLFKKQHTCNSYSQYQSGFDEALGELKTLEKEEADAMAEQKKQAASIGNVVGALAGATG